MRVASICPQALADVRSGAGPSLQCHPTCMTMIEGWQEYVCTCDTSWHACTHGIGPPVSKMLLSPKAEVIAAVQWICRRLASLFFFCARCRLQSRRMGAPSGRLRGISIAPRQQRRRKAYPIPRLPDKLSLLLPLCLSSTQLRHSSYQPHHASS